MKIKPLYQPQEHIDIKSYLKKCGVDDVEEYLKGGSKGIESCEMYEGMDDGWKLIKEVLNENSK